MSNKRDKSQKEQCCTPQEEDVLNATQDGVNEANTSAEESQEESEIEKANRELESLRNDHLRLMAEFDNYRKRTLKEKSELIQNGGERTLKDLLPIIDDIERALSNLPQEEEKTPFVEGIELIAKKVTDFLTAQGVKPIEAVGQAFNDEQHEAVAMIPAPTPEDAGKVIDCMRKGYILNDKVLRFASVVVGQ